MKIYKHIDLEDFEAWSGAESTKETIIEAGKAEDFQDLVSEFFPNGIEETELNDLLWFETEFIFKNLNIQEDE